MTLTLALASGISPWMFAGFVGIVIVLLALDLGVFHRRAHAPGMRESLAWTTFWIVLALAFAGAVYALYEGHVGGLGQNVPIVGRPGQTETVLGAEATKLYITAYLLEKSLSMDNLFVIAMIFASLRIPAAYQHRVLFWGILGALITRGLMIGVGAAVVASFAWVVYVFGGLLILSAIKMIFSDPGAGDPRQHWGVKLASRVLPISTNMEGQRLLSHEGGRWHGTPLLVALVVIEATDVMFAVDSIPAVFALTGDPFLVFTSNIMAILGLRSLYFCLASAMTHFRFLKSAVIAVLLFVGVKMCLVHTDWKVPTEVSMGVILGLLALGVVASLVAPGREAASAGLPQSEAPDTPCDRATRPSTRPTAR
ncbi:MAG: TerC family protein [Leptolyngbya sp. PLA3]|nr:MAG: TerC family protein [Cyanobacteria bacterium CYA]MCE7967885.1 TerC family protein [Leptolyngbya sp. PL-A3]